ALVLFYRLFIETGDFVEWNSAYHQERQKDDQRYQYGIKTILEINEQIEPVIEGKIKSRNHNSLGRYGQTPEKIKRAFLRIYIVPRQPDRPAQRWQGT